MTKKELLNMLDCQKRICRQWGECDTCPGGQLCKEAEEKIRRLIESSGEAEVGDEEREGLEIWLDKLVSAASGVMCGLRDHGASIVPHYLDNDENDGQRLRECLAEFGKKVKINKLLRQRRTVSRGKVHQIAERLMTTALRHSTTDLATDLTGEFAELGFTVEEPKEGEEEKDGQK